VSAVDWFLLGAPWDCSGTARGEQAAPDALRAAGLSALVGQDLGDAVTVVDSTDRDEDTGVLALPETVRAAHAVADALGRALQDTPDRRPLVVGGDCSILLGIVPALRRHVGTVGLWFIDGHPDFLDGHASETGETADMDLALLTGAAPSRWSRWQEHHRWWTPSTPSCSAIAPTTSTRAPPTNVLGCPLRCAGSTLRPSASTPRRPAGAPRPG